MTKFPMKDKRLLCSLCFSLFCRTDGTGSSGWGETFSPFSQWNTVTLRSWNWWHSSGQIPAFPGTGCGQTRRISCDTDKDSLSHSDCMQIDGSFFGRHFLFSDCWGAGWAGRITHFEAILHYTLKKKNPNNTHPSFWKQISTRKK